ncbi:hypothetical protein BGZ46_010802 [Entomortierella lignicola]|nr:hypothetical protein BGZ46_010802 [Entomortierella lignicola]
MSGIKGTFRFTPLDKNQAGALVDIKIDSGLTTTFAVLPTVGFEYHIHVKPVGQGGDCMATGGHLDPTNVGMAKCNPAIPEKCQEGDLSGKHGNLMPTESGELPEIHYQDKQLSFTGADTTIAGRSIVIHNNGTRVACADILPVQTLGSNHVKGEQDAMSSSSSSSASNSHINNGASADGRISTNEVLWTIAGTVASGIVAAMLSF